MYDCIVLEAFTIGMKPDSPLAFAIIIPGARELWKGDRFSLHE